MKINTSGFTKLFTVLVMVMVSALTFISGCRLFDRGEDSPALAVPTSISGRVVKAGAPASQRDSERPSMLAADASDAKGVEGAEVWIEGLRDDFYISATRPDGTYVFTGVPAGNHRIVIKYIDAANNVMKMRSGELQISQTQPAVKADDLTGKPAANVVTGQLFDAQGTFLPAGTILTLWGENFRIGQNGTFTSPPLPDDFPEAEILVRWFGTGDFTSFNAPFVSDVVPAFLELKVGADDKGNHAPSVVVSALVNGQMVSKVDPGAMVNLVAKGSAHKNQGTLTYDWKTTAGSLADGTSASEMIWTAPDYLTLATITVVVKDANNATGSAHLPILVGIDNPSQVNTSPPTVVLTTPKDKVVDSEPFVVTISFNKPVRDFAQSLLTVINGALSDFSETTASETFTVKVTPQTEGDVIISVAEKVVTDRSNNRNTASNQLTVANSITPQKSSEKAITAYAITDPAVTGTINQAAKTITVTVPHATDRSALIASFTLSDKATVKVADTLQVSGTTANDFTSPVTYKVIAEDGTSANYNLTVRHAANPAKAITAFNFASPAATGVVDEDGKTVAITVPFGTAVTTLTPTITHSGASVSPNSGVAQDFTNPVTYTVTAADASTQQYVVTVTVIQLTQINAANVTITAPVPGASPEDAAAVETATANADYTVTGLTWNEALTAGGKFKAGQSYTATVILTSKNGKKFQAAAFTPTVAGFASVGTTTTTGSAIGNRVSFTVSYAATGALAVTGIAVTTQPTKMSYAEATDGTLALNGMVVTETNNDGSSNAVTFTDGTATGYTASPANGTALTNETHNGQPVAITHTASSKTANTNNLAVAAIGEIAAAAVTITAPVTGSSPENAAAVETATANAEYTVTGLTWSADMTPGGKFKAEQAYTATVTLTSKNGKKFQATAFTPTVAGSASVGTTTTTGSEIGNRVSFTVTYAATGALAVAGIAVTTQPTKMSYAEATDGTLALNGMVVTETNNDGSINAVTFTDGTATGYTASPANGTALSNATHNGQQVTITHTSSTKTANTNNLAVVAIAEIAAAGVAITAPVLGASPDGAAAVEAATANADYTLTGLTWNEALTDGGKFKAGQAYTATVTLTSKNGKKFQAAAFTPTVAGSASVGPTTTTGSEIGNRVSFTVTYAATGALVVTGIAVTTQPTKISYFEGIDGTLALNGMVVTETNNDGSINAVTFTDGTATGYTANPANGTALTHASHNGQQVTITHTASSKTANTDNLAVAAVAVTITLPVLGASPDGAAAVEAATANADYTVTGVTWNEALTAGGKFKAGQAYTATVTLTSKNGKKFQAAAFTPTVAGSASVGPTTTTGSEIGNTVSFTVTYAATAALVVTGIAVTTQPTKISYFEATDGTLALNGMVVTETNNDGSINAVTFTDGTATGYAANPANGTALTHAIHNGQSVTITHTASSKTATTSNLTVLIKVVNVAGGVSFKVSYVPAATFPTGNTDSVDKTVAQPFWIGETTVTYELWYAVRTWAVDAARGAPYTFQNNGREGNDGAVGAAPTADKNEPVTSVSWRDAVIWCNALSEMRAKEPVYRTAVGDIIRSSADEAVDDAVATGNNGFRLPTEWEWELAARWKNETVSTNGSIFNNGRYWTPGTYASGATADYTDEEATKLAAWYEANSGSKTQNVGQKPAAGNHLGLYDMSGNVLEWCWSRWDEGVKFRRVVRGGSYTFNPASDMAVAYRHGVLTNLADPFYGFRVVLP